MCTNKTLALNNILYIYIYIYILQSPVTPLQKAAAEVPPMFNQILMSGQQEDVYGPPQKKIPTLLTWALGGKNIYIQGSWDNWAVKYARSPLYIPFSLMMNREYNLLLIYVTGNVLKNLEKTTPFC
jgi:hypothetical protein